MKFLERFFKHASSSQEASKNVAKERLKLALTYDRGGLAHGTIDQLRDEIIQVLAKHLAVSEEEIDIHFDRTAEYDKLIASIPLRVAHRLRSMGTTVMEISEEDPASHTQA